jgi:AraC-like DNA-binding protein
MTPHAYRLNRRIEQARRLLREGWEPARAALECGFFDQSHLHRHFRAIAAATPGEYRVNFVQ